MFSVFFASSIDVIEEKKYVFQGREIKNLNMNSRTIIYNFMIHTCDIEVQHIARSIMILV